MKVARRLNSPWNTELLRLNIISCAGLGVKQPSTRKISATLGNCDDEVRLVGRRSCSLPLISSHLKLAEDF